MNRLACVLPRPAARSRPTLLAQCLLGTCLTLPATAQFAPGAPLVSGLNAPYALALGDTGGPASLELVAAHLFPPFPPTGADVWSPGVGSCPAFGLPVALPFTGPPLGPPFTWAFDVAVAQIDKLGADDTCVLVVDPIAPYVEVSTQPPLALPPGPPLQILATDFDADTWIDLLVLDANGLVWFAKNTLGTLGAFVPLPAPPAPIGCSPLRFATGSFDGDALPDLVITWGGAVPQATVYSNVGGTSLALSAPTARLLLPGTARPGCLTVGDFDGDGNDDFVVLDGQSFPIPGGTNTGWVCTVTRFFPWPAVSVASAVLTGVGLPFNWPTAATCGDYDCDGDVDLVFASTDGSLYMRPNAGNGTFPDVVPHLQVAYASGSTSITDLETADVDRDGDLDVASCDWSPGGAVRLWCNTLPAGECVHLVRAGLSDVVLPVDCACPRPALVTHYGGGGAVKPFDSGVVAAFAHTFTALPGHVRSAKLTIALATPVTGDTLQFDLLAPPGNFAVECVVKGPLVVLDLADLPGGQNLLPRLEKTRTLDVGGAISSTVHWMQLDIVSCCEDAAPTILYDHTELQAAGGVVTFTIDAPPIFASGFAAIVLGAGVGCAHAPAPYESLCLLPGWDIPFVLLLDLLGDASVSIPLPVLPCCLQIHTQAVAIAPGWTPVGFSRTITDYTK